MCVQKTHIVTLRQSKQLGQIDPNLNYLYVMNQSVGKKSAHLCSFLEQLVFWTLCGLL